MGRHCPAGESDEKIGSNIQFSFANSLRVIYFPANRERKVPEEGE